MIIFDDQSAPSTFSLEGILEVSNGKSRKAEISEFYNLRQDKTENEGFFFSPSEKTSTRVSANQCLKPGFAYTLLCTSQAIRRIFFCFQN